MKRCHWDYISLLFERFLSRHFGPRNVIRLAPILTTLQIILESCFPPPRKSTFSPTFNSVSKEPFSGGVAGVPDANGGVFNGDGAYGGVSGAYGGEFNGDGAYGGVSGAYGGVPCGVFDGMVDMEGFLERIMGILA